MCPAVRRHQTVRPVAFPAEVFHRRPGLIRSAFESRLFIPFISRAKGGRGRLRELPLLYRQAGMASFLGWTGGLANQIRKALITK